MITSVRLNNWRSHSDTSLEFREGTNLLVGIMGSGKSSILDSVSFALFGTFPALERRRVKLEDVIRNEENSAKTELGFSWNGDKYRIEREIKRQKKGTSTDAMIYKNDSLVDKGTTAVSRYLEDVLHVDYDLFTRAIYSEQNNIDYFLTLEPKKRKKEIDSLLGLDKFENARGNLVTVLNRVKSNKNMFQGKLGEGNLEDTKKRLEEGKNNETKLKNEFEVSEEKIRGEKAKLEAANSEFSELKGKKDEHERLSKEKVRLESTVEHLRKEVGEKKIDENELKKIKEEKVQTEKRQDTIKKEMNSVDSSLSKTNSEIGSIDAKIKAANKVDEEISVYEKRISKEKMENLSKEIEKMEDEKTSCYTDGKVLLVEIKELDEISDKLKPGAKECPLCGSGLTEDKVKHIAEEKEAIKNEKKKKVTELQKRFNELKKEIEKNKLTFKELEEIEGRLKTLKDRREDKGKLESEKKVSEKKIEELGERKEKMQKEADELNKKVSEIAREIDRMEDVLKKKKELELSLENLKKASKGLEELKFDEKRYEDSRKKTEETKLSLEKLNGIRTNVENQLKSAKEINEMLEKEMKRLVEMEKEIKKLEKLEEELIIYKNALLETQTSLRNNLVEAINHAMNEIWSIFYPYRNYQQLRVRADEKDYSFEVFDGDWKLLETVASGGERACAALTLRVALATVLTPNLSWLILDEPTHNLDKEAVEMLSQALQYKVPEVVKQTFVITHEEALMGSEFASSYRFLRDKERAGPTKAEKI